MNKSIFLILSFSLFAFGNVMGIQAPSLTSPSNGSSFSLFTTNLTCSSVAGASGYQFQVDTVNIFNNPPFFVVNSTTSTAKSPVLRIGRSYFWRARCFNGTDTSAWSSSRSFTITSTNLGLSSPSNNSTGNIVGLLTMNFGTDSNVFYQFEVDTVNNLSTSQKRTLISNQNIFIDSTFFKYSQVIFWRARCFNMMGDTFQWSPIWRYTTDARPSSINFGSILTVDPSYMVIWPDAGLSNIHVQIDTSNNFNTINLQEQFINSGMISTSFENLKFKKEYFVRIRGFFGNQFSIWSPVQRIFVREKVGSLQPLDQSNLHKLSTNFRWGSIQGVKFQFQLFNNVSKTSFLVDTIVTSNEFIYSSELNLNTQYPWRVRAFHEKDTSVWTENTFKVFSGQVFVESPNNNSVQSIRPQFKFNGHTWATKYVIEIDTGIVWPSNPSSYRVHIDTFFVFNIGGFQLDTTLFYGQSYISRIYAFKGEEQAGINVRNFTTIAAPVNFFPSNNMIGTGPSTNGLITKIQGSTHAQWQIDTTNEFNSPLLESGIDPHIEDRFNRNYVQVKIGKNLRFTTRYFWRARCISVLDTSDWSVPFNFVTTQNVWLTSPLNGSVNIPVNTKLDWNIQGSNLDTRYQYQIATDSSFETKPIFTLPVNAFSEVSLDLLHNTRYFWRARAFHDKDTSLWSDINYFNTIPPPTIGVPSLISPAQGAQNVPPTPVVFSWFYSNNALSFDVQISTRSDFSSINASTNVFLNSVEFSGVQPNTRYYWRVRGRNGNFTSAWATRWFETAPPTSVEELNLTNATQIFPNPASSFISVRTKGEFAAEVMDISGRIVFEQSSIYDEIDLQTENWKPGLYVVRISKQEGQSIHKIWVQP